MRDESPASAVLTFGPFGGFHGHFDKLSFVYFALGKELAYDPGRARSQAYRLPIHRNWYRATTSHNTVLVDRISQEGVEGHCDLFVTNPTLSAVAASTDRAYEGVRHRRLLVLRPAFLLVADTLVPSDDQEHVFDWMLHNLGEEVTSPAAGQPAEAPKGQGFEYLEEVRRGQTDGPIHVTIATGNDHVEVTMNAESGSEVLVGTGVGESVLHRVPAFFVTRRGQQANFVATIEPVPAGESATVEEVLLEDQDGEQIIHIRLHDGDEEVIRWALGRRERNVVGASSRSRLLYLRRSEGQVETLVEQP